MHFTIQREALLKPLHMVMGAVERRQTLPILSNVRLEVGGGFLLITGTDLEIELNAKIPLTSVQQEGLVTIPARKFMDICRNFSENQTLELSLDESRVHIKSGRSKYVLNTMSVYEFPRLETDLQAVSFLLPSNILRDLVDQTAFSMAQQDVRYYLNGLLFDCRQGLLRAVATDGHRLATTVIEVPNNLDGSFQIIVPRKAVYELNKIFADEVG
ncbi:MAG: DNA polymerase III subunit beta, partial [Pseudomonadota bacterium]